MKKLFNYALIGAIALTGSTMLTSCSSSDDAAAENTNPNFNPKTNEVNVQFVLNVATNANSTTRSSATNAQATGNFRGMDKVKLFAFNTGTKKAVQKDADFAAVYDLDNLLAPAAITAEASNRIVNINIPIGTDAFLFYGKAIKDSNEGDEKEGKIDYSVGVNGTGSKLETKFTLQPRISTTDLSVLGQTESFVEDIINYVLAASINYTKDGETTESTMTLEGLKTQYLTEKDLAPGLKTLTPLELSLAEAYYKMTTIGTDELRAGSAEAILSTMADFKKTLKTVTNAIPTGTQEQAAHNLAQTLNTRFDSFFNYDTATEKASFQSVTVLKALSALSATWGSNTTITDEILRGFPQYFGLPAGCSLLTFDTSAKKFDYKTTSGSSLLDQALVNRDKMMYPAELTYYCNGPIRTSNVDKQVGGYPNGTSNWTTDGQWTAKGDWSTGAEAVTSSTRAAALMPNVNYGVAMLQSQVKLANVTAFKDNRNAITGEADQEFAMADIDLAYTGIIIGGQCPQVGWDFLRRQTTDNFDYMIFDNRIAGYNKGVGVAVPKDGGSSAENYTLLFDNYKCGTTIADAGTLENQNDVFVALEFVNKGDDFWGQGNLIRSGTTFYLIAKLPKPTSAQSTSFSWPGTGDSDINRYYEVPPINASGNSLKIARVFVQDYKTTATFTIGAESLKHALVTVPDLRSSQMSFGLSVDLTWKTGINFGDIVLGTY